MLSKGECGVATHNLDSPHEGTPPGAVLLVSPEAGNDLIASVSGAPTLLPVHLPDQWREAPTVTRALEEQLGCPVFLRRELPPGTGQAGRVFVAEVADRCAPGLSHLTWFPARERLEQLAELLAPSAGTTTPPDAGTLLAGDTFGTPYAPWTSTGWSDRLHREVAAYFGEHVEIRPLKLRHDRYLLRVACRDEFYEIHARPRTEQPVWHCPSLAELDDIPLLNAHIPEVLARWPHLGAELGRAPLGQRLADDGSLAAWDATVRDWATSQMACADRFGPDQRMKDLLDRLYEEFRLTLEEWRVVQEYIPGFGDRAFDWMTQSVNAAFDTLGQSRLPISIINGSLNCHTAYLGKDGMQVSEWEPRYLGHPFMNLATLLHVRGGSFTSLSQSRLAQPYLSAWLKNFPMARPRGEVRGAVTAGCAVQAMTTWRSTTNSHEARALSLGAELASWWEIIIRSSL
jgi:hypothetical protein